MIHFFKFFKIRFCFQWTLSCIVTVCLLNSYAVFGQTEADSLYTVWKNEAYSDSARAKALETMISKSRLLYTNPDSIRFHIDALADFSKNSNQPKIYANSINYRGQAYLNKGEFQLALEQFKTYTDYCIEINFKSAIPVGYRNCAVIYSKWGKLEEAREYNLKSLTYSEEQGDSNGMAGVLYNMGINSLTLSKHEDALEKIHRAQNIFNLRNIHRFDAQINNTLSNIYRDLGDFAKAQEHVELSLAQSREKENKTSAIYALINYALILSEYGSVKESYELYLEAEKLLEFQPNKNLQSYLYGLLGNYHNGQGNYNQSIAYYRRELDLLKELGMNNFTTINYTNMGLVYDRLNQADSALYYFELARNFALNENDGRDLEMTQNSLGYCYFESKDYEKGLKMKKAALDLAIANSNSLETYVARRDLVKMYNYLDSTRNSDPILAQFTLDMDQKIKLNSPILTEFQKEKYLRKQLDNIDLIYDQTFHFNTNGKQLGNVYNLCLTTKGLLLKSTTAMRATILSSGDSILLKQYDEWISIKRRIVSAFSEGKAIEELEMKANAIEKQLVKASLEFSNTRNSEKVDWEKIKSSLKDDEAAIEFIRYEHQNNYFDDSIKTILYAALLLKKEYDYPKMIQLFNEKELEKILGSFPGNNVTYIEQVYGKKKNTKSNLYNLIWKPMESELEKTNKVYISPVGLLHKISFSALSKKADVFLCDNYEIEMKSSTAQILAKSKEEMDPNGMTTLFGGIEYDTNPNDQKVWSYLDGSLSEVEQIAAILNRNKRRYKSFTKTNGSEEIFKLNAPESNILHIATHGFFYMENTMVEEIKDSFSIEEEDLVFRGGTKSIGFKNFVQNKDPLMRSGIIFAGANSVWGEGQNGKEDGVLTAKEVVTLDLRSTDLVVLSACETGLGDIKGSEGVYGLQRAFKMAGAKSLIMSLWQVPDKETMEFMTLFYKNLTANNRIQESFKIAQKEMRKKYDPYFWAAFVLIE
ncbi:MAG: CHAT domain-containing tetratricopeptide repeat protein [Crocinitomicaceae bacterium]